MANQVTLTFGGDAGELAKASKQAKAATDDVTAAVGQAGEGMGRAAGGSRDLAGRMGALGAATDGASTAIGDAAGTMQALVDIQMAAERKAAEHARALADVEQANIDAEQAVRDLSQAQLDQNQSMLDAKQATVDAGQAAIDVKQANLDATVAQKEYNQAVKEHGAGSDEARQAAIDLEQAQGDLKQANLDAEQATSDFKQAQEDGKQATLDGAQAARDGKDAVLNLADAQRAANPPDMQKWADQLNLVAPLLSGVVGVVALVTAAQWAWNVAQLASPTTWVVLAVVALIAAVVLIATKTTWFQDLWEVTWSAIKVAAEWVVNWIVGGWTWAFGVIEAGVKAWWKLFTWFWGGAIRLGKDFLGWIVGIPDRVTATFAKVAGAVSRPFRAAFNLVSDAWNNTIGRLRWTVPSWIPSIGGASISAPQLPKFHSGGRVSGAPGSEMLALLQAGETVTSAADATSGGRTVVEFRSDGSRISSLLLEIVRQLVKDGGGDVQFVFGSGA
ncbi:hypothetical protein ACH4T9_19980 [Micromonospora sp. NPDC020750]|uniref:hypothetical protein n=1 Tax=unclassified Micromonospora TaxID=2617518 RepID=UPI0037B3DF6E